MAHSDPIEIDRRSPPFDRFTSMYWLAPARSGHRSAAHARHHLLVGHDKVSRVDLLIKVTAKPGLVYQRDLANEIASLRAINQALPGARSFPIVDDHGQLRDGRVYMIASLFNEFPLATVIGTERQPARLVGHLRTAMQIAAVLSELHRLQIFHVDLNPMNILYRAEKSRPLIRIVDFESSYETARHSAGDFYSPPTTPGYCAPEVSRQAPDARSDLFSLGATLYTMLAGYQWTWSTDVNASIRSDRELDREIKDILTIATESDPDQRYRSTEEFRAALAAHLERIWPGRA